MASWLGLPASSGSELMPASHSPAYVVTTTSGAERVPSVDAPEAVAGGALDEGTATATTGGATTVGNAIATAGGNAGAGAAAAGAAAVGALATGAGAMAVGVEVGTARVAAAL